MLSLIKEGQFESAEILVRRRFDPSITSLQGSLLISSGSPTMDTFSLYADCLYASKQYRRALLYYERATTVRSQRRSAATTRASSRTSDDEDSLLANIRFKMAKCFFEVNDKRSAVAQFEAIPHISRTLSMNMWMGKMLHKHNGPKNALPYYKEAIRQNPALIEILIELVKLNVPVHEIKQLNPSAPWEWLEPLLAPHVQEARQEYKGAVKTIEGMERQYPNSLFLLSSKAKCEYLAEETDKSCATFKRILDIDPHYPHHMEVYAASLRSQGKIMELNKISANLLTNNPNRSEGWAAAATYWYLKGDKKKAASHVETALFMEPDHHRLMTLRGDILAGDEEQHERSVELYRRAAECAVRKGEAHISHYVSQVKSLLSMARVKEALVIAKEARKAMPNSPRTFSLLGVVLSKPVDASCRKKSRQCFDEALKMDPDCIDAILGLADLNMEEKKTNEAGKQLLAKCEQFPGVPSLHVKLAEVYIEESRYNEALNRLQLALNINPYCEGAREKMELVEKKMKGIEEDEEIQAEEEERRLGDIEDTLSLRPSLSRSPPLSNSTGSTGSLGSRESLGTQNTAHHSIVSAASEFVHLVLLQPLNLKFISAVVDGCSTAEDAASLVKSIHQLFTRMLRVEDILHKCIETELTNAVQATALFRTNNFAARFITFHTEAIGRAYIENVLATPIKEVLLSDITLEALLEEQSQIVLECIYRSSDTFPVELKNLYTYLRQNVAEKYPGEDRLVVANFLFLRFFNAYIVNPPTGLLPEKVIKMMQESGGNMKNKSRTNLMLISKMIQTVANSMSSRRRSTEADSKKTSRFIAHNMLGIERYTDLVTGVEVTREAMKAELMEAPRGSIHSLLSKLNPKREERKEKKNRLTIGLPSLDDDFHITSPILQTATDRSARQSSSVTPTPVMERASSVSVGGKAHSVRVKDLSKGRSDQNLTLPTVNTMESNMGGRRGSVKISDVELSSAIYTIQSYIHSNGEHILAYLGRQTQQLPEPERKRIAQANEEMMYRCLEVLEVRMPSASTAYMWKPTHRILEKWKKMTTT
ncbi:hypothetical protein PROFUN_11211 [Planoprotostelium fungivorum]|uniref:Ras-GAP domain-containing protein n=1 Tax=Planoprotostelium fungivorum TaxID=1890364 RepID=A0A2P6NAW6_9EUKA|nr:hypothetical protein PROFUN_11211 [Planoprotostelium fungivorum]